MALEMFDGFEIYGVTTGAAGDPPALGRWSTINAAVVSTATATPRTGSYCLQVGNTLAIWTFTTSRQTRYYGFGRCVATGDQRIFFHVRDGAGTIHVELQEETDQTISVLRGDGTSLGRTTATIPLASQWHYMEVMVTIDNSAGAVTLRMDGTTILTLTGVDTQNGGNATHDRFALKGQTNNTWFDDVYADDAQFHGPVGVYPIVPDGAGQQAGFSRGGADSGANWSQVEEIGPNDDTDYNYTSSVGAIDLYTTSEAAGVGAILGLQIHNYAKKTDASARSVRPMIRTNSTNSEGAEAALATSYAYYTQLWEDNPVTATAWTASEVNALQIGTKLTA